MVPLLNCPAGTLTLAPMEPVTVPAFVAVVAEVAEVAVVAEVALATVPDTFPPEITRFVASI
jgi:hypothetical protein